MKKLTYILIFISSLYFSTLYVEAAVFQSSISYIDSVRFYMSKKSKKDYDKALFFLNKSVTSMDDSARLALLGDFVAYSNGVTKTNKLTNRKEKYFIQNIIVLSLYLGLLFYSVFYLIISNKYKKVSSVNVTDNIFFKLEELMKNKIYLSPSLSRSVLAEKLNTNRTTLSKVIQEKMGMSLVEYINAFRLQHVCLLMEIEPNLNIQEIYLKSGFVSRVTFNRLFTEKYKMTPVEFRKNLK